MRSLFLDGGTEARFRWYGDRRLLSQLIILQRCVFYRANNDRKVIQANKVRQESAPNLQMSNTKWHDE